MALPFDDSSFDAATMGYGLRNVSDIPAALQVCGCVGCVWRWLSGGNRRVQDAAAGS